MDERRLSGKQDFDRRREQPVVNLVERVLEVFREPGKGGYRRRSPLELGSRVTPEAWPDPELAVASFLPEVGRLAPDDSHRAA